MGDDGDRLTRLEEGFEHMKGAIDTMQKNIEQILDKLDNRYPTKETIDLQIKLLEARIGAVEIQHAELRKEYDSSNRSNLDEHKEFNKTVAKASAVVGAVTLVLGIAATFLSHVLFH